MCLPTPTHSTDRTIFANNSHCHIKRLHKQLQKIFLTDLKDNLYFNLPLNKKLNNMCGIFL